MAEKGHGAFLNNKRLRVAARKDMASCVLATGLPFMGREGRARAMAETEAALSVTSGVRRFGAASLDMAYVAAGRFDGYWERGVHLWDIAAGLVLVREAGGVVSDTAGRTEGISGQDVVCANEHIHPQLLKLLKGAAA